MCESVVLTSKNAHNGKRRQMEELSVRSVAERDKSTSREVKELLLLNNWKCYTVQLW